MRNDKEDTILRSDAIEAVYRAYRRPSDDEVFIRMREELERVPGTSMATIQANVEVDMDELVKRVTEEIRYSFILDPVKRGKWMTFKEAYQQIRKHHYEILNERESISKSARLSLSTWVLDILTECREADTLQTDCEACELDGKADVCKICRVSNYEPQTDCGCRMKGADDE